MDDDSRGRTANNRRNMDKRNKSTCQQLADIIGGQVITSAPACVVQRLRNINATILSRRTQSPLALPFALSFENNIGGKTLNLGETVILQREINPFLTALRRRGIIVTAVHNHWLFENPRLCICTGKMLEIRLRLLETVLKLLKKLVYFKMGAICDAFNFTNGFFVLMNHTIKVYVQWRLSGKGASANLISYASVYSELYIKEG